MGTLLTNNLQGGERRQAKGRSPQVATRLNPGLCESRDHAHPRRGGQAQTRQTDAKVIKNHTFGVCNAENCSTKMKMCPDTLKPLTSSHFRWPSRALIDNKHKWLESDGADDKRRVIKTS